MEKIVFEKSYEVHSYDTGTDGKLRPDALLSYLQDIAGHHASILKVGREELLVKERFWALVRIVSRLSVSPLWNDTIHIKTWPSGIEGIFAIRNFQICNSKAEVIGEASSSWVIVNSGSRRPVRPEPHLAELGLGSPVEGFLCKPAEKLQEAGIAAYRSPVKNVRYSDLDVNMHVNNAKYLQWILDSYPLDFIKENEALVVEANYIAETLSGDDYMITSEESGSSFHHSVIKRSTGKEACRFRIEWQS